MSNGVSTEVIIKAAELGFKITEVDNKYTSMFHVIVAAADTGKDLFSMFLLAGGLYHWEKNISLPKSVIGCIDNARYEDDSQFMGLLELVVMEMEVA